MRSEMSETINDIVREMRDWWMRSDNEEADAELKSFANRIEAAVKTLEADRDNWRRQALAEDERANIANSTKPLNMANREETDHFRDVTKMDTNSELLKSINSYQINSSKAREALEKCLRYLDIGEAGLSKGECDVMRKVMRDALSNPPRNCDRLPNAKSPLGKPLFMADKIELLQFIIWLFAEVKGDNK
jgi:hypothetical protein